MEEVQVLTTLLIVQLDADTRLLSLLFLLLVDFFDMLLLYVSSIKPLPTMVTNMRSIPNQI